MSSSLFTQYHFRFKRALASRFACFLSPLLPTPSKISSKRLHSSENDPLYSDGMVDLDNDSMLVIGGGDTNTDEG